LRRVALSLLVLLGVSLVVFVLERALSPPSTALFGQVTIGMSYQKQLSLAQQDGVATQSCPSLQAFEASQPGCLVPWYEQYFPFLQEFFSFDVGNIFSVYASSGGVTVELLIISSTLLVVFGLIFGVTAAAHRNASFDYAARLAAYILFSVPVFITALFLKTILSYDIYIGTKPLLQTYGELSTSCAVCFANPGPIKGFTGFPLFDSLLSGNIEYFWDTLLALILPALTLGLAYSPYIFKLARTSMLNALSESYVMFARSKGMSERIVVYRHALKNAALPTITITAWVVASMLGGVTIVDLVFGLNGIGSVILGASQDFNVQTLADILVSFALIVVIVNLVSDVLYALLDPRIRF
jgi:ABC-type dipeptide/oligopeptide/nickel transport system permease component